MPAKLQDLLRSARKRKKLSQSALAMQAGVSLPSVHRMEKTGKGNAMTLIKILSVLDVSEHDQFLKIFLSKDV